MLLDVQSLSVAYDRIEAVRGFSLAVEAGEAMAVLGPNGAGKTSAVEAIAGLLPKRDGKVSFGGKDVSRASASSIALQGLALVPQWRELFPGFTVHETLEAGLHAGRGRGRIAFDDLYELFPKLAERRWQTAGTLSGGEQQMLALARALATEPYMLLLDEPTAGLAVGIVRTLIECLKQIRRRNIALVVVEQNMELASAVADRCIVLSAGAVVWRGSMADAVRSEDIRRHYFGAEAAVG